jgi:glycosyltransferase involved in cell wall biosynthesis
MEKSLVSVILPTQNREKTLVRAINSILEQTYKNIEVLVVNDASTDNTYEIASGFSKKDSRIIILNNEKKLGLTESLNKGIGMAKGKYIARLDDDDFWCNEKKLEEQVDFLEKNKDYVLVGGGAIEMDQNGKDAATYFFPEKDSDIRKKILIKDMFIHVSVVFVRDAWERVAGYDKKFNGLEDWDLWLKMGTIGKFYNIQHLFVRYAGHYYGNPSHFNRIRKKLEGLKLRMEIIKKYSSYYPGQRRAILFCFISYIYSFFPLKLKLKKLWT